MLPPLSRAMRVALTLALAAAYIGWHTHDASAKKHDDAGDDGDDDDSDDDSGKGDKDSDDGEDEEAAEEAKDQPPVTAGGLYTLQTYPLSEIQRPLTITKGVTQLRLGIGTDISAKGAFGSAGVSLEGEYGVYDNFMLIGGLTDAYNFKQYSVYAGFEASIIYDLLDFRMAANLHRNAYSNFQNYCSPLTAGDPNSPTFNDATQCGNPMASIVTLPDGSYGAGGTKFSIDIGFPIRYAFKPQFAVVLGQSLISIDFNGTNIDHVLPIQTDTGTMDALGNEIYTTTYSRIPNGVKPDLNLSGGLAFNPIPQLSIVAYAQLKIADFDTSADNFQVPVTLRIEGSLSHQLDIGLEFTLLNIKPPDPESPIDNRYISAFAQARY